jgi:hypothetical protein
MPWRTSSLFSLAEKLLALLQILGELLSGII